SEEHTSELQSRQYLVCRLLLEKKNQAPRPPAPPESTCPGSSCDLLRRRRRGVAIAHARRRSASSRLFASFFFNDTPTTEIYTLSLHDALPIFDGQFYPIEEAPALDKKYKHDIEVVEIGRHTSELQSRQYLVCRLLLEKKK